jgi:hypothetical protein
LAIRDFGTHWPRFSARYASKARALRDAANTSLPDESIASIEPISLSLSSTSGDLRGGMYSPYQSGY